MFNKIMFGIFTIFYIGLLIYNSKGLDEYNKFIEEIKEKNFSLKSKGELEKFIKRDRIALGMSVIIFLVLIIISYIWGEWGFGLLTVSISLPGAWLNSYSNADTSYAMNEEEIVFIFPKRRGVRYDEIKYIRVLELRKSKVDYKKRIIFFLKDYSKRSIRIKSEEVESIINFLELREIELKSDLKEVKSSI